MEIGKIKAREIVEEMQDSFLDYSMSVIVDRALPDVRDGLKPVHRRILYAMWQLGLTSHAKFRKSAAVVGEVLGKYHPHGDLAVYDTMVRMAQDFAMRYPLVDGQGNFGSMDGDSPAAQRYTEARLTPLAEEILADIEKETVKFKPNYDGTRKEPCVLPSKVPQLLLNGTLGIAVGMATSMPPHNFREVAEAIGRYIDDPEISVDEILEIIKGPDFPTGAVIFDRNAIKQAYATGRGGIVVRAKADIVEDQKGAFRILISEIPYQVNKAQLMENIAELVKEKKLEGIRDIRDESDKDEKVRMVIELKKDAFPKKVLNQLYQHTALQSSFHLNLLALVDGIQPKSLNIKSLITHFVDHRAVVVTRRTQFDLERAKERAHILEGLSKALDHIDAVIKTIKASKTKEIAHQSLRAKFKFSDRQATAILEMRLQSLAGLERQKIEDELKEKRRLIAELEGILKSRKKIFEIIKKEISDLAEKYGDERRTRVVAQPAGDFTQEDLVPDEAAVVTLTRGGYIKRMPITAYHAQGRGGKGVIGMTTKEEDAVEHCLCTSTHSDLLFFTNRGRVFQTKTYEIPEFARQAKGQAAVNFLQLAPEEKVTAVIALSKETPKKYLFMLTQKGTAKKTDVDDFTRVRRSGLIAINLTDGDELRWVRATGGGDTVIVCTQGGQAIHFKESDVRPMGRAAAGVRAIKLKKNDLVVGMNYISKDAVKTSQVLNISQNGYGKRSRLLEYKIQHRGGSGIKTSSVTKKTGQLVSMDIVSEAEAGEMDMMVISTRGQVIRTPLKSVSILGRATQGVRIMRLNEGDKVASITLIK